MASDGKLYKGILFAVILPEIRRILIVLTGPGSEQTLSRNYEGGSINKVTSPLIS
jgi:hypothetical protein